jgi:N-acetylmuramoyl-L-alanine amidase
MRLNRTIRLACVFTALVSSLAFATTEELPLHPSHRILDALSFESLESSATDLVEESASRPRLDPYEAYLRTIAVLDHFGVPAEPDSQAFFDDLQGHTDLSQFQFLLEILDPNHAFATFSQSSRKTDSQVVFQVFQDSQSKRVLDYSVNLASSGSSPEPKSIYRENLKNAANNNASRPLAGLKIALDPGHMGGDFWDDKTGKYVRDKKGRQLSEGVLALQISLLLEKSLKNLGAEVRITRYGLNAVTQVPYDSFDVRERGLMALREDTQDSWFQKLLATSAPGPKLYSAFENSVQYKYHFTQARRWDYFILGYDLDARVDAINEFHPDLTLIIHLDAGNVPTDPNGVNSRPRDGTKVYVPGAYSDLEFSSRFDRKFFGRHLLDFMTWNDSVKLARSIAHSIHDQLGVPFDQPNPENSVEIEPGVQARNLRVQRQLTSQATAYVECLFYNDPNEFEALLKTTNPMMINGVNVPYSDRLAQLAAALRDGVVSFVASYKN